MTTVFARNLADMSPQQRLHLEHAIGEVLPPQGRVFVMASDASTDSADTPRQEAHARLLDVIDKVAQYQLAVGITPEEAEAVIDATVDEVRRRRGA